MALLRLAVAASLMEAGTASTRRGGGAGVRVFAPALPSEERQRQRWQRIWMERRAATGASEAEAGAALQCASVRAILALLDHQADAALVDTAEAAAAWPLLEPRTASGCADLYVGAGEGRARLGWCDCDAHAPPSGSAGQLRAASLELARLSGQPAVPAAISLSPQAEPSPEFERLAVTLGARGPAAVVQLYSPLFFREGKLQAEALLNAIGSHTAPALPVLGLPAELRAEFAAAWCGSGGAWTGALRAGAEAAAARISASASAPEMEATVSWLLRRAALAA